MSYEPPSRQCVSLPHLSFERRTRSGAGSRAISTTAPAKTLSPRPCFSAASRLCCRSLPSRSCSNWRRCFNNPFAKSARFHTSSIRPCSTRRAWGRRYAVMSMAIASAANLAVDLEVAPDAERLPPDVELVLFRLVQEALTNVSRHSQSPTARIRLARKKASDGRNVVLTIEDAGRGMPAIGNRRALIGRTIRSRSAGVGLASMRERLHQIGGRLEIDSDVRGTIVRAVIPIDDDGAGSTIRPQ